MRRLLKQWQQTPRMSRWSAAATAPFFKAAQRVCGSVPWMLKVNGGRVKCDGIELVFPPDTGIMYSTLLYWRGSAGYEGPTWGVLKSLIQGAGAFLDIGSNIGLYAVLAAKLRPELSVDAFEPVPSLAEGNRKFHAANGLPTARVHELAISDRTGGGHLTVPKYDHLREAEPTATLQEDVHLSPGARENRVQVATETLDGFLRRQPRSDRLLLNIDVEGDEASVLYGGIETLATRRPIVVCEMLPKGSRHDAVEWILAPLSYELWSICREGLFRFSYADLSKPRNFTDFLLVPRENVPASAHYIPANQVQEVLG